MFSKVKYITAPTLSKFRKAWSAKFLRGFVFQSKIFDGLKGSFPIGFLVWDTGRSEEIHEIKVDVLDKGLEENGTKTFHSADNFELLTDWVERPKTNDRPVVPLKNAVEPATVSKDLRGTRWSDEAIGYLLSGGNDIQHSSQQTVLFSSGYSSARGYFINEKNLWKAAILYSVRRLIKPTWLNDRDQFLQPSEPISDEFKHDCLMWMLFSGSNLSAGADGLRWNNRDWSLVNHFVPFTEQEVGAGGRFESRFMVDYLRGKVLSPEAQVVLNQGREIWRAYHRQPMPRKIREEFKLNRPDAGWYQIRNALKANEENQVTDFSDFKSAYEALSNKLRPMVYDLGFLKA